MPLRVRGAVVVGGAVLTLEADRLVVNEVPQARVASGDNGKPDDDA